MPYIILREPLTTVRRSEVPIQDVAEIAVTASYAETSSFMDRPDKQIASSSAGATFTSAEQDLINQMRQVLIDHGLMLP